MSDPIAELHASQIAYWNGVGGDHWVRRQELTDLVLAPVAEVVLDRASARPGDLAVANPGFPTGEERELALLIPLGRCHGAPAGRS